MPNHPQNFYSYVLRAWRVNNNGDGWRVRLTQVDSGEEKIFTDMEELFAYLQQTLEKPELEPTSPIQSPDSRVDKA